MKPMGAELRDRGRLMGLLRACLLTGALAPSALAATPGCPPSDWSRDELQALKASQWSVDDATQRTALALALLACLSDPDPVLRDAITFEALQTWLRAGDLDTDTARMLGVRLLAALGAPDPEGVGAPFAMLTLAEVIRDDRVRGIWTPQVRQETLSKVAHYMQSIRDYRGFEPDVGWRHGVAHTADALMQFALNASLDRPALDLILAAVASQVAPSEHAYVDGEGERLARPVLFIARRGLHSTDEWTTWFTGLSAAATPPPGTVTSEGALARLHNVKGFLYPLYVAVQESNDDALRMRVQPGLRQALQALP